VRRVQARARGVYDALHAGEINAWLATAATASLDVVVAADVFIYLGALEDVFRHVARSLREGGWFAFSTEECPSGDYVLQSTGRYAHARDYVVRLARPAFTVAAEDAVVIRMDAERPLPGRLYLLRRGTASAG
jgi:predicted TPR repeat methyltransferase